MIEHTRALALEGGLGLLYAIASISGALGGCAVSCYYVTHDQAPRWAFAVVYTMIGLIFGALTFAGLAVIDHPVPSPHHLILYAAAGGTIASLAMASLNMTVKLIFKRLGLEVQITLRKSGQERRDHTEAGL